MDPILGGGPFSICLRCHQKMDLWQENGSKAHLGWGTILHVLKVLPEYGPMAYPAKWNDDPFWEDHWSSQKPPCTSLRSSIMESWVSMRSSIMESWVTMQSLLYAHAQVSIAIPHKVREPAGMFCGWWSTQRAAVAGSHNAIANLPKNMSNATRLIQCV